MNNGAFFCRLLSYSTPSHVVRTLGFLDNEAAATVQTMDEATRVRQFRSLIETFMCFDEESQVCTRTHSVINFSRVMFRGKTLREKTFQILSLMSLIVAPLSATRFLVNLKIYSLLLTFFS
jgi:hypothetical protein